MSVFSGQKLKNLLTVFALSGVFLLFLGVQTVRATVYPSDYGKLLNGMLTSANWNKLLGYDASTSKVYLGDVPLGDFVNTTFPAMMAGPLGIGVGPVTGSARLTVKGDGTNGILSLQDSQGGVKFNLLNNGNIGIGITDPGTNRLYVAGGPMINALATTHSMLAGAGGVLVMADNTGTLYSTTTASFISNNGLSLWSGSKNSDIWNGDAGVGKVGIGTTGPRASLDVSGAIVVSGSTGNTMTRPAVGAARIAGEISGYRLNTALAADDGFMRLSAGGGSTAGLKPWIDLSGYSTVADMSSNIAFGVGATEVMRISNGNVGIGTTGPLGKLHVKSSASGDSPVIFAPNTGNTSLANNQGLQIYWNRGNGSQESELVYGAVSTSYLSFIQNNAGTFSEKMRIDAAGNVGIGTTNPTGRLTVIGPNASANSIVQKWGYGGGGTNDTNFRLDLIQGIASGGVVTWNFNQTNNGTVYNNTLVLDRGNVGIGTTAPAAQLHVEGATPSGIFSATTLTNRVFLAFYNKTAAYGTYSLFGRESSAGGSLFAGTSPYATVLGSYKDTAPFQFSVGTSGASAIAMTILSGGNVGIGITDPGTNRLYVAGGAMINALATTHSLLGSSGNVLVMADNTGALYSTTTASFINNNGLSLWHGNLNGDIWNGDAGVGRVGIGTTAPRYNLSIGDDLGDLTPSVGSKLLLLGNTTGNTYFAQGQSATNNAQFSWIYNATPANAYARFVTYGYNNDFRIDAKNVILQGSNTSGNVGIGTTNPLVKLDVAGVGASGGGTGQMALRSYSSTYSDWRGSPGVGIMKSHNDTIGINSTTQGGEILGQFYFGGVDAAGTPYSSAIIEADQVGAAGTGVGSIRSSLSFMIANGTGYPTALFINKDGNVGIGITAPGTNRLYVAGGPMINALATTHSLLGSSGNVLVMADNTGALYSTTTASFINNNGLSLWHGNLNGDIWNGDAGVGRVGIGTTTPAALLDVNGTMRLGGATRTTWTADAPIYQTALYGTNGDLPFRTTANAAATMRFVYGPFAYAQPSCGAGYAKWYRVYAEYVDNISSGGQVPMLRINFTPSGTNRDFTMSLTYGGSPSYRTYLSSLFQETNTNHANMQTWVSGTAGPYVEIRKIELWAYCL